MKLPSILSQEEAESDDLFNISFVDDDDIVPVNRFSDDEDDTHPNIDTPSLFKWRHEARVQRMEEMDARKKAAVEDKKKKRKLVKLR